MIRWKRGGEGLASGMQGKEKKEGGMACRTQEKECALGRHAGGLQPTGMYHGRHIRVAETPTTCLTHRFREATINMDWEANKGRRQTSLMVARGIYTDQWQCDYRLSTVSHVCVTKKSVAGRNCF